MSSRGTGTDFFISHAGRATAWTEWLAWQLQQAGYSIELDVWGVAEAEILADASAAPTRRHSPSCRALSGIAPPSTRCCARLPDWFPGGNEPRHRNSFTR